MLFEAQESTCCSSESFSRSSVKSPASPPILGALASILIAGYFCAIYFEIIHTTTTGGSEAPDFPEITSVLEDLLYPALQVVMVYLFSFAPLLAYSYFVVEPQQDPVIYYSLLALSVIYAPMAMLAVVVLGNPLALSPHVVIPAIFRAGFLYWVVVCLICLLYLAELIAGYYLANQFIVGPVVLAVIAIYAFMTNARALGVVFREREKELNWI